MKLKQLLLILAGFVVSHNYSCEALRIIGIFPLPGKSHFIPNFEILKGLAKRGHQVDVVSHFPLKNPLPNYTDIPIIESTIPAPTNNVTYDVAKKLEQMSLSYLVKIAGIDLCDFLSHKVFQELLKPPKIKYDIVIVEVTTLTFFLNMKRMNSIDACNNVNMMVIIFVTVIYCPLLYCLWPAL